MATSLAPGVGLRVIIYNYVVEVVESVDRPQRPLRAVELNLSFPGDPSMRSVCATSGSQAPDVCQQRRLLS